ncbi:MAG: M48 family metalloprotease [Bacteroidales bacterium]|nr:M48 family metalloprotease [Bacteroidales bacterium]
MKRLLIILLMAAPFLSFSQSRSVTLELEGEVTSKISRKIKKGDKIQIMGVQQNADGYAQLAILHEEGLLNFDYNKVEDIQINPSSTTEFWQAQALKQDAYEELMQNGFQYEMRKTMEEDAEEYVNRLDANGLIYHDSYLESYLTSLAYKILPGQRMDGRPGFVGVKVKKDVQPNAFSLPNGTLLVTTGLLTTLSSEEELTAALAHEMAHFVLDHHIRNINEKIKRQKRAKFWGAVASAVAAAAGTYAAQSMDFYNPGIFGISSGIAAYSVISSINERLGLKYSREQEFKADAVAIELLNYKGISESALASALHKVKHHCHYTGNFMALSAEGSHPSLDQRISKIGNPSSVKIKKPKTT